MEEGSLLQEALDYMERLREDEGDDLGLQNVLQIDVYDLEHHAGTLCCSSNNSTSLSSPSPADRITCFQRLADLAVQLNAVFKESEYPWVMGGDGPIFGTHASEDGIPHLRALCRYGFNVRDEWKAIQLMLDFTKQEKYTSLAVDCWDLDDGPLFLIQCADELPYWLDDDRDLDPRHICWLMNGRVKLVGPKLPLSLKQALELLKCQDSNLVSTPAGMQRELHSHLDNLLGDTTPSSYTHRTAVLLPRPVAWMVHRRPDLVPCIVASFEHYAQQSSYTTLNSLLQQQQKEDWVWATIALPQTHYAMLRTLVSPSWRSETYMPYQKTVEWKRLVRTCQREATPHLRHAWQVGMRITAGVDYVLLADKQETTKSTTNEDMSAMEQRIVAGWGRVDQECGGGDNGRWLLESWQAGPNHARHDLTSLMQCPVFALELANKSIPCPLSHPGETLQHQLQLELKRKLTKKEEAIDSLFDMPRAEDVDSDEWLRNGDAKMQEIAAAATMSTKVQPTSANDQAEIDSMLANFQQFMNEKSDIEGVSHDYKGEAAHKEGQARRKKGQARQDDTSSQDPHQPVNINPRVFLNMLHTVLKSTPEEITSLMQERDPFFSEEDYAMMEEGSDDSSDEEEHHFAQDEGEINALMKAMDEELRQRPGASRIHDESGESIPDDAVAQDAHVLSNLLQSLDASGGAPGPVRNILREMGANPPVVLPDASSSDDEDADRD